MLSSRWSTSGKVHIRAATTYKTRTIRRRVASDQFRMCIAIDAMSLRGAGGGATGCDDRQLESWRRKVDKLSVTRPLELHCGGGRIQDSVGPHTKRLETTGGTFTSIGWTTSVGGSKPSPPVCKST